jgi:hypothetical protein
MNVKNKPKPNIVAAAANVPLCDKYIHSVYKNAF